MGSSAVTNNNGELEALGHAMVWARSLDGLPGEIFLVSESTYALLATSPSSGAMQTFALYTPRVVSGGLCRITRTSALHTFIVMVVTRGMNWPTHLPVVCTWIAASPVPITCSHLGMTALALLICLPCHAYCLC